MMGFIEKPNLPVGRVCTLICGTDDAEISYFFLKNQIRVLKNAVNPNIDAAVCEHADMAALHLGGSRIIIDSKQLVLKKLLVEEGMEVIETSAPIMGAYPNDVKLNFTLIDKFAIGNFKYPDSILEKILSSETRINVKQGYCKCSTLVVNENAVITDDESIHRKALGKGLDCLLVSKGDIHLQGHEYGFIGGASGKIAGDTVLFFGDIKNHRDFEAISSFIAKHGCCFVCTDNGPLRDIGGIIPLKEIV